MNRTERLAHLDHLLNEWAWRERHGFLDVIRPFALTLSQWAVLSVLERSPHPLSISEIGDLTLTPPSSMTHTIDRLVERDLIARSPHPTDRRTMLVSLTDPGNMLIADLGERRKAHFEQVCGDLTDHEIVSMTAILEKLAFRER